MTLRSHCLKRSLPNIQSKRMHLPLGPSKFGNLIHNSVIALGGAVSFENGSIFIYKKIPSHDILMTDTRVLRSMHAIVTNVRERYEENPLRIMHVLDQMGDLALHSVDIYSRPASNSRCEEVYSQLEDLMKVTSSC